MFGLQGGELVIILLIVLLLFGGAKIPQLMRGLGRGMGELQEGIKDGKKKWDDSIKMSEKESDEERRREDDARREEERRREDERRRVAAEDEGVRNA
jgi:sec-independent protein translocase protein TatA